MNMNCLSKNAFQLHLTAQHKEDCAFMDIVLRTAISSSTRPDISYSVNYLSRYQNSYNETHWKYAVRILKYLYLTKDLKMNYKRNVNCETIECYVENPHLDMLLKYLEM